MLALVDVAVVAVEVVVAHPVPTVPLDPGLLLPLVLPINFYCI